MKSLKHAAVKLNQPRSTPGEIHPTVKVLPFPDQSCANCRHVAETGHADPHKMSAIIRTRGPYAEFSYLPTALHQWRLRKGLKISAAASGLGVAASTWGHWETGFRFPTGSVLLDLVRYTGMSLVELICEHGSHCPMFHVEKALEQKG
jgi:DNA-binding transcriptional regulator YiaG